jgi:N-acetylglutamate synthase-like GNAT family acetyltransferase
MTTWRDTLKPDVFLGAFAGEQLVGMASLRHRLAPNMAQLTTLHVSKPFRRAGVARELLRSVMGLAKESGARSIYVSATPSESAVGFYLSQGFRPADVPDPEMFRLEPEDIHMIRALNGS